MIQIKKNDVIFNISDDSIRVKWFIEKYSIWEPYTFRVIDDLFDTNKTFIDVGCWIGPVLLYVATKCKKVIGVDCDHVAFESIIKNVNCNDFKNCVQLEYSAIYKNNKKVCIGGGKLGTNWGSSKISIVNANDIDSRLVESMTLDDLIEKYNVTDCDFVKIDIEGSEKFIFQNEMNFLKIQKPTFYISVHPHLLTKKQLIKLIFSIFDQFPYIYDINYNILDKIETMNLFLKNKKEIEYKHIPSNIGHEIIGTFKKI